MIHGGIDGFSRLLVFLQASPNNMKSTVLRHFLAATSIYGLPSRVRVDHGGENNDICDLMELLQGRGRGSAIRGTSVHNQRIERVWVDTWNGATNLYYDLFHFLEHQGSLDINNQNHMWALHYVFLPRINRELQAFVAQWNNHGLRTEHYQTPVQLFVGRSLCNKMSVKGQCNKMHLLKLLKKLAYVIVQCVTIEYLFWLINKSK